MLTGDDLQRFWAVPNPAVSPTVQTAPLVIIPLVSKRI